MLNETEIPDANLDLIDVIPDDAFQIQNLKTNSCLTVLKIVDNTATISTTSKLYHVSTAECNSTLPQQFWKWTDNDTILHIGSYLCLATVNQTDGTNNNEDWDVDMLVLMPCVESDGRQKWSCSGRYIQQPTSGKCITEREKEVDGMDDGDSTETSENSNTEEEEEEEEEERERRRRNTDLRQMVEELGQFLNNVDDSDNNNSEDSTDRSFQSSNGITAHQRTVITVEYCTLHSQLQMWFGIPKGGGDGLSNTRNSNNDNSICSQNGTSEHTLPACYTNNMESISQVTTLTSHEWITCDKHGYYVTGFYHTHIGNAGLHVRDGLITGMQCCATNSVFTGEPESPVPDNHQDDCDDVEWWSFQDVLISEGWFLCPKGKFLKGFEIGPSIYHKGVHRIYKASCCRPHSASDVYKHCYTDKSRRIESTGIHTCRMEGYLVTAMYLDGCVDGEGCTEKLTCCIEA